MTEAAGKHFGDRLIARVRELGHPLCVGLDPHLDLIPAPFRRGLMLPTSAETAAAVEEFLLAVLDRIAGRVAIVKPQAAFFELLGWRGFQVLERIAAAARERGLLVLLDAKRGDVPSTAAAYAAAYLGPDAAVPVDAVTANPYLGTDALAPFAGLAEREGRGLFVLVKTSNSGSGEFQDRSLGERPLYEEVAGALAGIAARLGGPATGWSSLGVIAGATYPEQSARIREQLPNALLLAPGFDTQGGSARDAVAGFTAGPDGRLEGGIVNSSRGILFPAADVEDARAWERALDAALGGAIRELEKAVAR